MRAVIQRVAHSRVQVDGDTVGEIDGGLLVLVGVAHDDTQTAVDLLAEKITELRIFADDQGRMNRSILDVAGEIIVVSQFTLLADCRKGRRPSFTKAAHPDRARDLYRALTDAFRKRGISVATGRFGAEMSVDLTNDGPVTLILDTADYRARSLS